MDRTIAVTSHRCRSRRRHSRRPRSTVGWTKSSYIVALSVHYNNCMRGSRIHYGGPPASRSRKAEVEAVPQENARNFVERISRVTAISRLHSDDVGAVDREALVRIQADCPL